MSQDRTPDDIRDDISARRDELADTAAALAQKADVKTRAKDRVDEIKADVKDKVGGARAKAFDAAPQSSGDAASSVQSVAASAQQTVKSNPVPTAAIVAVLAGFALGYLIARRRT